MFARPCRRPQFNDANIGNGFLAYKVGDHCDDAHCTGTSPDHRDLGATDSQKTLGGLHMAGVFNGLSNYTPSHRARLPSVHNVYVSAAAPTARAEFLEQALHIHGGVWGAITDRLLSKAASHKDLFEAVAKALDSQCCASLPFEVHVIHASRKVLKVRATRPALCDPPTRIDADLSPPTLDSTDTRRRIWADTKRVQLWAASLGDHTEHHATCEKGFSGRFYCRMNKPTGHGEETKPKTCVWQLVRKREAADEFIAEHLWLCRSKACNEIATCDPELSRWDPPQRTHEIYVIEPRALPLPTLDGGGTRGLVCSYAPTPFCLGTPSALTQLSLPCTCTCVCGWVGATIAGGALAPAQGHACAGRRTQTPSPRAARVSPAAAVGQLARRADDRLGDRTEDAGVSPRSNAARYGRTLVA